MHGLRKSFGEIRAVDDVDFTVPNGSLFAFVGRNGAGKSTTIGCLTTVVRPDGGEATIGGARVGRDDARIRRHIGVVFQTSMLDASLTVRENLVLRAGLYGMTASDALARTDELAELVGLETLATRRYGTLSGGERRRVDIARALLHHPAVLFLDEPTAGLDPRSREQVWAAIDSLRAGEGLTVFLTTHYLEETDRADRVCIIDEGRVLVDDTPSQLRRSHSASRLSLVAADAPRALARIRARGLGDRGVDAADGRIIVTVADAAEARAVLDLLGDDVLDFEFRHGSMDDVFLAVTGRTAGDA
ncbi:MAG: ABC transporter ATP-binding protein [Protaetiibacter sp.]